MNPKIFLFAAFIFFTCICCSNTPRGVDINPVYHLKVSQNIKLINILADSIAYRKLDTIGTESKFLEISSPFPHNSYNFRDIMVREYPSQAKASIQFISEKTPGFMDGDKIYDEGGIDSNRYLILYEPTRSVINHGFFMGFDSDPIIKIVFQKGRYLFYVSYWGQKESDNYKNEINEDILYLSMILKKYYQ